MNVEEGWERITEEMKKFGAVFLCDIHAPLRNKLVKFCYAEGIRSYITPKISDIIIRSSENIHFFDTPLLLSRNNGFTFEQKLVKRTLDIIISVFMLVIHLRSCSLQGLRLKYMMGVRSFSDRKGVRSEEKFLRFINFEV